MAKKEANFDLYIHDLLVEAGIQADTQGSNIIEINNALKSASKHKTGNVGFPEYCAVVNDFVLVMEDKADRSNLCAFEDDGTTISLTVQATKHYAVNGALHYAKHILQNTTYDKIFAFGNAGDRKHHIIQPLFVDTNGYTWLPEVETFENFSANHILEYYKRIVLKETPPEDIELADILKKAKELHEYLRNYGGLGEDEKPLVVSAILLALREQKYSFRLDMLKGDFLESNTDGAILYQYLETNLQRAKVAPEVKKARVLNQFTLIKDRPQLNTKREDLGNKTPLKFFAEYINENIFKALISNSNEDYLGRFYVKRFKLKAISGTKYHYLFFKTVILQQKCKYAYGYKFNEQRMQKQMILLPVTNSGTPDYDFMEQYIKEREQKITQNYISFIDNDLQEEKTPLSLEQKKWNTFFVGDLFTVRRPQARSEKQYQFGSIPFIASGNTNNGLTKCCMPKKEEILDEGNCITISPVDGSTFYQETAFLGRGGAGSSILILYNSNMNRFSGLFIARMLRQTCSKYSYGKMGNKESIKREKVMLPINDNGKPDYLFMEQYIKYIILKLKTKYLKEK